MVTHTLIEKKRRDEKKIEKNLGIFFWTKKLIPVISFASVGSNNYAANI